MSLFKSHPISILLTLVAAGALGCSTPSDPVAFDTPNIPMGGSSLPGGPLGDFESDDPDLNHGRQGGGGPMPLPSSMAPGATGGSPIAESAARADSGGAESGEAARAISEADIIQIEGDTLYALSKHGGLSAIDISTRDQMKVLGRFKSDATPFEMYVQGDQVFGLFTGWGHYAKADGGRWDWVQTSWVVILDVSNPSNIHVQGEFELPGDISDSRIVGDVLYVVSYENGYCYKCEEQKQTTVVSLDVSNPRDVRQVDRLSFKDANDAWGWSKRSITVTQDRMYVAGREYSPNGRQGSTIQVVDISDPAGDMVTGAAVEAEGEITSRWQMSEFDGVLRVISQPPRWSLEAPPVVQTFSVESSQKVTPLASLSMRLPRPEQLQSVRFDGDRAYAITFERTDPLFTLDLSDPAAPKQRGELEIPGWVYHMEPRGDRVLGLGFENIDGSQTLHVSNFDVSDLDNPTMLNRVNFGGDWSSLAEDQDRIHKAFKILPDEGLLLVPFSGWSRRDDQSSCRGEYVSGVQLIDFGKDTLDLRGVAESRGNARRAFLHDERLFTVSDERVETFDVENRDAPVSTGTAALAQYVSAAAPAGQNLVRLGRDWSSQTAQIDVVRLADADSPESLGKVDLESAVAAGQCGNLYGTQVFGNGEHAYITYSGWDSTSRKQHSGVAVLDLTDAETPTVVSNTALPFGASGYRGGYGLHSVIRSGERMVQVGSTLGFLETQSTWDSGEYTSEAWVHIVDLSDPSEPKFTRLDWPHTTGLTGLIAEGDSILTSHFERVADKPGRAKFYLDRIDISDPVAPKILPSLSIPGSLFAYSPKHGRAVTVDYTRFSEPGVTHRECYENHPGGYRRFTGEGENRWDWGTTQGTCEWVAHTFKLVSLGKGGAFLEGSHKLSQGTSIGAVAVGEQAVFAAVRPTNYYYDCWGACLDRVSSVETKRELPLLVLGGLSDGNLTAKSIGIKDDTPWGGYVSGLTAYGDKALVSTGYHGELVVIDAKDPASPRMDRVIDVSGHVQNITQANGLAIVSLGYDGVELVDLTEQPEVQGTLKLE